MKRIGLIVVGTAALVFSTATLAQPNTSSRNGTMVRAIERVSINAARNPQAPGLGNAAAQLAENAQKHLEHGNGPGPRAASVDRPEGVERPERPQIALSPNVIERPLPPGQVDRPLPRGLVDRPLPPGHARVR